MARGVELTLAELAGEATHWTEATIADASSICVKSVQRNWRRHGLAPHCVRRFKLSSDPDFITKLRDVVELHANPPAHTVVLSVDETSQLQALDLTRTGPLPEKGPAGTVTYEYKRHGTTTLFSARTVLDGTVMGRNTVRHRHQEFIRFLNVVPAPPTADRAIHVILDNCAAREHPKVRRWLARNPRINFRFSPTAYFLLNAIESFFAKLTKRRLKCGVFCSVVDFRAAINRVVAPHNFRPKPIVWTAYPDRIIAAVELRHQSLDPLHLILAPD